jgi:Coenzyme PQQ synthesis protein D (PqqD)
MAARDDAPDLCCRPDVIWDEVDGRMVIYNLTTHALLELNATAAFVWRQIAAGGKCNIVEAISARYPDVDESRLARDVDLVLTQFIEANLVAPKPADAPGDGT